MTDQNLSAVPGERINETQRVSNSDITTSD